jgi:hypothetical protein
VRSHLKNNQSKKGWGVGPVIECLPNKCKTLISNPSGIHTYIHKMTISRRRTFQQKERNDKNPKLEMNLAYLKTTTHVYVMGSE